MSLGFTYKTAIQLSKHYPLIVECNGLYIKNYDTQQGNFVVGIKKPNDYHTELPEAYALQIPELLLNKLLPHINFGGYLCYSQESEAEWDPNNIKTLYLQIDQMIQTTLNNSVKSLDDKNIERREMEGEFAAYWDPSINLYLLTVPSPKIQLISQYLSKVNPSSSEITEEIVTYEKEQGEYKTWANQRGLSCTGLGITTRYFTIKAEHLSGENWPLNSFSDFLKWLVKVNYPAVIRIIDGIIQKPKSKNIILFDVKNQDLIAVYVELNLNIASLQRHKFNKKVNYKSIASILSHKKSSKNFRKIRVLKTDKQTILTRNQKRPYIGDLRNKKIALIGCGTIGGYLAPLVLRSGAGCGIGFFHLFDHDIFQPHNFGRHYLLISDVGEFKSIALEKHLKSSIHIPTKIHGFQTKFSIYEEYLAKYDIIIDTTGRVPISKRLAYIVRKLPLKSRPVIIHSFNDGNGRVSKVMIDQGQACYNCLLQNPNLFDKNGNDKRLTSFDIFEEKIISCGNTFAPYDATVSIVTAGLTQEAVLSTLEEKPTWSYKEHLFEGNGRTHKPVLIKRSSNCNICNE